MGEEIQNAAITIPRMIISSIFINGVVALSSLIGILFCIGNADDILDSRFYFPLFEVFLQATRSVSGSAIMSMIIVILQFATEISTIASGSRMLWSFSRDRGLPGSRFLSKVSCAFIIGSLKIVAHQMKRSIARVLFLNMLYTPQRLFRLW